MAPATTMLQEPKARVDVQHAYPRPTLAQPKALESHSENNCAWQQLFNFEFFRLVCWYVASFFLVCLRAEAHTSLTWKGFQKHKQIVFLYSILNFHRLNIQIHVKFYPIHSFRTIFPSSEWKLSRFVNFLECDPGVPFSSLFSVVRPCWKCGVSLLAKCWPIIWWLIIHAGVQANHFETGWSTDHISSYNSDHMRSFATLQATAFMKPQNCSWNHCFAVWSGVGFGPARCVVWFR